MREGPAACWKAREADGGRSANSYISATATAAVVAAGVRLSALRELGRRIFTIPEGFVPHATIAKIMKQRLAAVEGPQHEKSLDFGAAENLAYATLLSDGFHVRMPIHSAGAVAGGGSALCGDAFAAWDADGATSAFLGCCCCLLGAASVAVTIPFALVARPPASRYSCCCRSSCCCSGSAGRPRCTARDFLAPTCGAARPGSGGATLHLRRSEGFEFAALYHRLQLTTLRICR